MIVECSDPPREAESAPDQEVEHRLVLVHRPELNDLAVSNVRDLDLRLVVPAPVRDLEMEVHERHGVLVVRDHVVDVESCRDAGLPHLFQALHRSRPSSELAAEPVRSRCVPGHVVLEGSIHRVDVTGGERIEEASKERAVRMIFHR